MVRGSRWVRVSLLARACVAAIAYHSVQILKAVNARGVLRDFLPERVAEVVRRVGRNDQH